MEGKICTTCKEWKPFSQFHKYKRMSDGHEIYCKECRKGKHRKYYDYVASGRGNGKERNSIETVEVNGVLKDGKICTNCKEWKEVNDYHKFSRMPDGLEIYCKDCRKIMLSEYFQTDAGKENAYKSRSKRRSRMNGVKFTAHFKKEIFKRDKYICQHCGIKVHDEKRNTPDKAHADHKISLFDGGDTVLDNMQTLCRTCNLSKGKKSEGDYQLELF